MKSTHKFIVIVVAVMGLMVFLPSLGHAQDLCFAAPRTFTAARGTLGICSADLDNDGDSDLVVTDYNADSISVLINHGDGTFLAPANYSAGDGPLTVAAADFDVDGDLDLAVGNDFSNVAVLKNNGNGTFGVATSYPAGAVNPSFVCVADLDADGDVDLAVANYGSAQISILKNDGNGVFSAPVNYTAGVLANPRYLIAADLDADGDSDLAVGFECCSGIGILKNNGDGTFGTAAFHASGDRPWSISAADLDGDGDVDLAVANVGNIGVAGNLSVLKNNGDGSFASPVNYEVGFGPESVFAADLNGDGSPDLAVVDSDSSRVVIRMNNGDGSYGAPTYYVAGGGGWAIFACDLDGDGDRDLAKTNAYGSDQVSILKNNGAGNFNAAAALPVGINPRTVSSADLDGDGDRDLVVANFGGNNISVLKNDGGGNFAAAVDYPAGTNAGAVAPTDLDGDGDIDLAVANYGSANVSVLKNNGDGTFAVAVNYAANTNAGTITAADLDSDGDMDLAVANYGANTLSVLKNNGDGTFAAAVEYATELGPRDVLAADLDGDGTLDLVTANQGSNNVTVLKNNGDGSFAAAVPYPAGSAPRSVAAWDLDGDNKIDLAVANYSSNDVSVLLNTGGAIFAAPVSYPARLGAISVEVADLDGDGKSDLVTANYASNGVSLLKNLGTGSFAPAGSYAAGFSTRSIAVVDLDGDGDLDLAVANYNSNNVSVLRNCGTNSLRTVSTLGDSGPGSLRSAITFSNTNPGPDTITFSIAGTIQLLSPLPPLSDPSGGIVILGFTAPGASTPFTPTIMLDGSGSTSGPGVRLQSADNRIEGLTLRGFNGPGVAVTGISSVSNAIAACRSYGNAGPGIDLGNDGITANDIGDLDTGPNTLLNCPVFDSILEIRRDTFTVCGAAAPKSRVELYLASESWNPSFPPEGTNHGPAYRLLGWTLASDSGLFAFDSIAKPQWSYVTATATDTLGNTSEFAQNKPLTPDPVRITAYSEAVPPLAGTLSLPLTSPSIQVVVFSPPNSLGRIDTIGPPPTWPNTFGSRASYDSLTDYNSGGRPDTRVKIISPDTGQYQIVYVLIGDPGSYLTGIGIDGHAEVKKQIAFAATGQVDSSTYRLAPPSRGELTADGVIDVFDVINLIDIAFGGAPMPDPPELADVNCDVVPDVFDVIYLIDYAFSGGPAPCQ